MHCKLPSKGCCFPRLCSWECSICTKEDELVIPLDPTADQIWASDSGGQKLLKGMKLLPSFWGPCLTASSSVVHSSKTGPCQCPRYSTLSVTVWVLFMSPQHPTPSHHATFPTEQSKLRPPTKLSSFLLKLSCLNSIEAAHPLLDHREIFPGSLSRPHAE